VSGTIAADDMILLDRAAALDAADELAGFRDEFQRAPGVIAYLDGNSLGRPLRSTGARLASFVDDAWGTRLIRSWDDRWMQLPTELGDRIGAIAIGAAPGQTVVADSTTVLLYKLVRAALDATPGRDEIVMESTNFPTDRYVVEGIAAERAATIRWIDVDPIEGVTEDDVATVLSDRTAVVVLSHVDFRSAAVADMAGITTRVKAVGALMLWDLCHSAGVVPVDLDACGVDLAVGCTYKYLNGGPGAPAFAYVSHELQGVARQPIWGWMGTADVFAMGPQYVPAGDIRQFISGTPPIVGMLAMEGMLDLVEAATLDGIRRKSTRLGEFFVEAAHQELTPKGVELLSPSDAERRGGHVTIGHPRFRAAKELLWERGIIPDFRPPQGLRIGMSPLSTSFSEVAAGVLAIRDAMGD
jgi:kynureninase